MIIVFWVCSMKPETCTHGHFNQVVSNRWTGVLCLRDLERYAYTTADEAAW